MEEIDAEHELLRKAADEAIAAEIEREPSYITYAPKIKTEASCTTPTFDSPKSKVSSTSPDFGPGSPEVPPPGWRDKMLSQSDSDSE